jgi:hypothetical protein
MNTKYLFNFTEESLGGKYYIALPFSSQCLNRVRSFGTKRCSVCEEAERKTLSDCLRLESVDEFLPQMPVHNFPRGSTWHVMGLQKNKLTWTLVAC